MRSHQRRERRLTTTVATTVLIQAINSSHPIRVLTDDLWTWNWQYCSILLLSLYTEHINYWIKMLWISYAQVLNPSIVHNVMWSLHPHLYSPFFKTAWLLPSVVLCDKHGPCHWQICSKCTISTLIRKGFHLQRSDLRCCTSTLPCCHGSKSSTYNCIRRQ